MKNRQPPEGAASLHLRQLEGERWTWRYVDERAGIELHSNETYASRDAAAESAAKAYPGVSLADDAQSADG